MSQDNTPVHIRPHLYEARGTLSLVLSFLSVVCILVIFFQKVTENIVPVQGVQLELPHAAGDLTYAAKNMIVSIDKDGSIYFADFLITGPDVKGKAKDVLKNRIAEANSVYSSTTQGKTLIIRADVHAPLSAVATVMSSAKELNMNVVLMSSHETPRKSATMVEKE